ncbi:MAG: hypothetical protein AAF613_10095 [Pseudomonadota bacterium]
MITFIASGGHKYAAERIANMPGAPDIQIWSYNRLLRKKKLPVGTYIFTDFDRLTYWHLELASLIYRELRDAGATVLNDPARALQRLPLLKQLHHRGHNSFQVWDAAVDGLPDRYPVFLRTRNGHRGTLTELLETAQDAEAELESAIEDGYVVGDLMFVEYRAQPTEDGVFRKLAMFRVGETMIATPAVHERDWQAKLGEEGVASAQMYQEDYDLVATNRYADAVSQAFDVAKIDYGRADYAIVDGKVEIYEINTNPFIDPLTSHPHAVRLKTDALFCDRLVAALREIDRPVSKTEFAALDGDEFVLQRQQDRLVFHDRWVS